MRNIIAAALFVLVPLQHFSAGAQSEKNDAQEVSDETLIKEQRAASNQAIADRDADAFLNLFDQDYIIMYGSSTKTLSLDDEKQSIRTLFSEYPDVNYVRTPADIYISSALPLAVENGTWKGGQSAETTYSGRYTAAWRKVDGTWKIHNELFVTLECSGKDCEN